MLKLNITKALHDYIISNPVFIKNWNGLSSAQTDLNTTYNNFIALTLNKAFDINNINNLKIQKLCLKLEPKVLNLNEDFIINPYPRLLSIRIRSTHFTPRLISNLPFSRYLSISKTTNRLLNITNHEEFKNN